MANGVRDEYRKKSTILGDKDILQWQQEQKDLRKFKERKQKEHIIDNMPDDIKDEPLNGVEKEQLLRGMTILEIYKRRMRRE